MMHICNKIQKYIPNFPTLNTPWELMKTFCEWDGLINLPLRKTNGLETAEVYAHDNAIIQPYALFTGRVILCEGCLIGPYTFIRGPAFIGPNVIVGPHSEIIRTIIMDRTVLAHRNLIGDTIFGEDVSCAGLSTVCNVPVNRKYVKICHNKSIHKHEGKFGAIIGNRSQLGCLTIIMPGCNIPDDTKITGQCVVYGDCKIKPFLNTNINPPTE